MTDDQRAHLAQRERESNACWQVSVLPAIKVSKAEAAHLYPPAGEHPRDLAEQIARWQHRDW